MGVAVDAGGNVFVADAGNHRVQKFTGTGAYLIHWGSQGVGDGQFGTPEDVAVDDSGNVYVLDGDDFGVRGRVQKFKGDGTYLTKWGTYGQGEGEFSGPEGLAVDAKGYVYVADLYNERIQKFSSTGTFITAMAMIREKEGWGALPSGIAVAADGSVYVAIKSISRIQRFEAWK